MMIKKQVLLTGSQVHENPQPSREEHLYTILGEHAESHSNKEAYSDNLLLDDAVRVQEPIIYSFYR